MAEKPSFPFLVHHLSVDPTWFLANFKDPKNDVEVVYILVQKGQTDPYYAPGQKQARLTKEWADLDILMTGGLKPEYYICKRIFIILLFLTKF